MLLSYIRTIVLYLVLIAIIRLMGKRQIGQMEASEFVVTMLVANLASIPMQDEGVPLHTGLVPMITILGVEFILTALSMASIRFRRLLCGKPVILIENGHILQENLRRTRVTLDELTGHLREKDILDLNTVQFAILETDGNLSVFPYPQHRPATAREMSVSTEKQYLPITIIGDGQVYPHNLAVAGKDRTWLDNVLQQREATVAETWLLTVDRSDRIYFLRKESTK